MSDNPRAALLRKKTVEAVRQLGANQAEVVELFGGLLSTGLKLFDAAPEKVCDSTKVPAHFSKGYPLLRGPRCLRCGGAMPVANDASGKPEYRGCR